MSVQTTKYLKSSLFLADDLSIKPAKEKSDGTNWDDFWDNIGISK